MKTLLLDRTAVDLVLDAYGNIACATEPYQFAQDAASAIRTFRRECWYDTTLGLPYWPNILGQLPPASFVQSEIVRAALTVPNVVSATVTRLVLDGRELAGSLDVTDSSGETQSVSF
ncbi:hypothetical protein AAB992_13940 [Burkholderia contaminans]|uniref:hypothetical protein n=1 Tax=Burkholderia contaminans TaxID=488447 RepID=UPI0024166312|nr:hypothetical protein [Burkholderia contaminans]WFN14426.1 hypothetical protein LXE92_36575 [Burkholderia contaminans]